MRMKVEVCIAMCPLSLVMPVSWLFGGTTILCGQKGHEASRHVARGLCCPRWGETGPSEEKGTGLL